MRINTDTPAPVSDSPNTLTPEETSGTNYIDPDERAGLPGVNIERSSQATASKAVEMHKHGIFGRWRHRRDRSKSPNTRPSDVERDGQSPAVVPQSSGQGVLSALLMLYENATAASSSASLTPRLSPGSCRDSPDGARRTSPDAHSGRSERAQPSFFTRPLKTLGVSDLPPQTRNAAGVFGPLIASTGNITGAAAPKHSTIAPSVKRPGFHLSRYGNVPSRLLGADILPT